MRWERASGGQKAKVSVTSLDQVSSKPRKRAPEQHRRGAHNTTGGHRHTGPEPTAGEGSKRPPQGGTTPQAGRGAPRGAQHRGGHQHTRGPLPPANSFDGSRYFVFVLCLFSPVAQSVILARRACRVWVGSLMIVPVWMSSGMQASMMPRMVPTISGSCSRYMGKLHRGGAARESEYCTVACTALWSDHRRAALLETFGAGPGCLSLDARWCSTVLVVHVYANGAQRSFWLP